MNDYDSKQKKSIAQKKKKKNFKKKKVEEDNLAQGVNFNQKMNKQSFPIQPKPVDKIFKKENEEENFKTIIQSPNKMNFGQSHQDDQKKKNFYYSDFQKNDEMESASNQSKGSNKKLKMLDFKKNDDRKFQNYFEIPKQLDEEFFSPSFSNQNLKTDSNKNEKNNSKPLQNQNIFKNNKSEERTSYHENSEFFNVEYQDENNPKKRKKNSVSREKEFDSVKKEKNKEQNWNIFDPKVNPEKFVIPQQIIDFSLLNFDSNFSQIQVNLNRKFLNIENVSQIYRLTQFADEYENEAIKNKIFELSNSIPFYRKIRGDGNCFFRAVAFNYIESQIVDVDLKNLKNSEFFQFIQDIAQKKIKVYSFFMCGNDSELENILMKNLFLDNYLKNKLSILLKRKLEMLREESQPNLKNINKTIKEEFLRMLNQDKLFDLALIAMIRSIVIQNLFEKKDDHLYSPFMFDFENLNSALINYGQEAENLIITLTADALNSKIVINMIHVDYKTQKKNVSLLIQTYTPLNEQKVTSRDFNLFFRPGHYDLGYSLKDADDFFY